MKSVKKNCDCEKKQEYPCLMEGEYSGNIYLMTTETKGTIVFSGPSGDTLGHALTCIKATKPFNGSIYLEN